MDWPLFSSTLETYYTEFFSRKYQGLSSNSKYKFLVEKVTEAFEVGTPVKKDSHFENPVSKVRQNQDIKNGT